MVCSLWYISGYYLSKSIAPPPLVCMLPTPQQGVYHDISIWRKLNPVYISDTHDDAIR